LGLIAFVLLAVPRAGAEPIQWSYQGSVVTTGPSDNHDPHVLIGYMKTPKFDVFYSSDQAQFADVTGSGSGSTSVTAFQMRANTDFGGGPFSKDIHTFNLAFAIRDTASGANGTVSFTGTLDGFMKRVMTPPPDGSGWASLQVGFTGPTQKSLVLGDHLYKFSIDPFNYQAVQDLNTVGHLPYISPYQNVPINVAVSDMPEPSALALTAAGLAGLGLRTWRRRRARRSSR
jgi:hypothetical protein